MSDMLTKICELIEKRDVRISDHGYDEAVLVTAYRPNPGIWSDDYTRRKK